LQAKFALLIQKSGEHQLLSGEHQLLSGEYQLSSLREMEQVRQNYIKHIAFSFILTALLFCSCGSNTTKSEITAEMALEGVSNYCHSEYDWSMAKDNPDIMGVQMGEESDSVYQVVFRSYTGAFVNFYVDKASGTTRMEEYVPTLDVKSDAGTIDIFDYIDKDE
jgi:hypothetical protein